MSSSNTAFNAEFDARLRSYATDGAQLLLRRVVKEIDQLAFARNLSCLDPPPLPTSLPRPERARDKSSPGAQSTGSSQRVQSKYDTPLLHHTVLLLRILKNTGESEWVKLEFVKGGLQFEFSEDEIRIPGVFHEEDCPADPVSPLVIADALTSVKGKTYNTATWNCNNVADMLWDAVVRSSHGRA